MFDLFVKNFLKKGGLSMPSITTRSWFSASPPPPPMPPGNMKFMIRMMFNWNPLIPICGV